ncbi:hypothetical protein IJ556_00110 [bacterium]|nr:hypothetical protein [bacterium]
MFSKLKSIIFNHAAKVDAIKQAFTDEKKKIFESSDYSTAFKDGKYAEIKEKYDADRLALIMQSKNELNIVFSEIFTSLENAITADIGQDVIAELNMIAVAKVSEFEMNAYAKKYSGKYAALRFLNDIAKTNKMPFSFVSDTEIIGDLNDLKSRCISFINIYDGVHPVNDYFAQYIYMSANDAVTENNLFTNTESEYNSFLKPSVG